MAYVRLVQAGDLTELYKYQKNWNVRKNRRFNSRNKRRKTEDYKNGIGNSQRSGRSVQRSKKEFFRLVASNLQGTENPIFITLTVNKELLVTVAYRYFQHFIKRLRRVKGNNIRYIAVPEWQPVSGFIHFHCLFWGLQEKGQKGELIDRDRRNYQRLWLRGYCDVRIARDSSLAIAGYMAKYLAKATTDPRLRNIRAYSASGNVKRPYSAGSNTLGDFLDDLIDEEDNRMVSNKTYDTMWLGRCDYQQYIRL